MPIFLHFFIRLLLVFCRIIKYYRKKLHREEIMEIVKSAANTLFNDATKNLSMDIVEMGLDSVIDNEVLKELPFVKTVYAITKTSLAIKEKFLLKKFLNFIKAFNEYEVDEKEINRRKKAIDNNEKWIYEEIEFLMIYLDNMDSMKKSKLLANLYSEYINRKINWERFCQYTEITNRLFSYDIEWLVEFYRYCTNSMQKGSGFYYDLTSYSRLSGLGLIEKEFDYGQDFSKYGHVFREGSYVYRITYSGKILGKICGQL